MYRIVFLLSFFGISGISAQTAPEIDHGRAPTTTQWTIMVYLCADNNLEECGVDDANEMELVGSDANIKIVVLFDRVPGYDGSNGDWTDTRRGLITFDADPAAIASTLVSVGEKDMSDPATVVEFCQWAISTYPAQKYALILWNHGGGWRVKRAIEQARRENLSEQEMRELLNEASRDVCWDDTTGADSALTTREVREALEDLPHIELLGCDACLMGMIECMHDWRSEASVFVGSEASEPGDGWPYDDFLADLKGNPTATAATLGTYIVNRYGAFYPDETQSAFDLTKIAALSNAVNDLATALMAHPGDWPYVDTARYNATKFEYQSYRDLRGFAVNLASSNAHPDLTTRANQVITALDAARIAYHGENYWDGPGYGVSIYFQDQGSAPSPAYNADTLLFAGDTAWDDFLAQWGGGEGGELIPPSNLATSHSKIFIYLTWQDNSTDESGFEIQRTEPARGRGFTAIGTVGQDVTSYTDRVEPGTEYVYRVRAFNATQSSGFSQEVTARSGRDRDAKCGATGVELVLFFLLLLVARRGRRQRE